MAVVAATLQGCTLAQASFEGVVQSGQATRKVYLCTVSVGQFTSGDTVSITGLDKSIQARLQRGTLPVIRQAMGGQPGIDSAGSPVYAGATVTAGTTAGQVDFGICNNVTANASSCGASTGVTLFVVADE